MRGYENKRFLMEATVTPRYESPCGVMRTDDLRLRLITPQLRIPMRGYEIT